jgi:CheY-like chemotaxis protein
VNIWEAGPTRERFLSNVLLEVSDTGTGMDEETKQRCLEPFFSTKGQRGTGLGLAMVYGVVERHEGKIEIQSAPGQGTTFRLIFPMSLKETAAEQNQKPISLPPLRILCIDDEPLLRELVKELLESEGHSVVTADGGKAGIEAFMASRNGAAPFDVVITDLGMPYVDGRKVAQTLKASSPETPIIMLTGWGTMMKSDGDFPAQVDAVLSKPPRLAELNETLLRLIEPVGK